MTINAPKKMQKNHSNDSLSTNNFREVVVFFSEKGVRNHPHNKRLKFQLTENLWVEKEGKDIANEQSESFGRINLGSRI